MKKRRFIWSATVLILLLAPLAGSSQLPATSHQEYRLHLYHTHTGERLDIVYRRGDSYIPEAIGVVLTIFSVTIVRVMSGILNRDFMIFLEVDCGRRPAWRPNRYCMWIPNTLEQ